MSVAAAARLNSKFHGRAASKATETLSSVAFRQHFAVLGDLISLRVKTLAGFTVEAKFPKGQPKLECSADGRSLYVLHGDQTVSLTAFGLPAEASRDMVALGACVGIEYFTQKGFHNFDPTIYRHRFGAIGGRADLLAAWQKKWFVRKIRGLARAQVISQVSDKGRVPGHGRSGSHTIF